MSFSEYFSNYIKSYNISLPKLAKILNMERSTLYRYMNGDRLPKNIQTVEYIANGLCMKTNERIQFLEEYDKSVLGDDIVNSYLYMYKLLKELLNVDDFFKSKYTFYEKTLMKGFSENEDYVKLTSKPSIISYVIRMFQQCANSTDIKQRVMLYIQPAYTEIQELLLPFFSNKNIQVDHVICFEKSIEKCYINLDILKEILPQSFNLSNYNIYYHYDNLTSHLNTLSLLPNLIITEKCTLMFDYEMHSGFFTTNQTLIKYFTEHFDNLSMGCFSLFEKGDFANNVAQMNSAVAGKKVGSLFNQPCVSPCLDIELLKESIYDSPQKEILLETALLQNGNWNGMEHFGGQSEVIHITSCCTKNGIIQLAETGRIVEIPEQYYEPISINHRINVLKRMILLMESEKCSYIVLKNNISLPSSMQIYWNPTDREVSFRYIRKDSLIQSGIKETSIYNTVINFLQYIEQKNLAFTQKECVDFIRGLIENLERNRYGY